MLATDTLQVFVAVMEAGSFSAAAQRLGMTPSGVSRCIAKLERQLQVRLLTRTTRRLDLTDEGQWLLASARDILGRIEAAESALQSRLDRPAGRVRVNAATPVLTHLLAPLLPAFLAAYPNIALELTSEEQVIDLIEEQADVAIRVGPLADSTLNARLLLESPLRLVAAPDYLARAGMPPDEAALAGHALLGFSQPLSLNLWPLQQYGKSGLEIRPALTSSSGSALHALVLAGAGIACLSDFLVREDLRQGRLRQVLPTQTLPWRQPVWAVYYKQGHLPPRIAHFLAFLQGRLAGWERDVPVR
jgi:DNA-binding transcriptional LysR family regulator